jgi:hypothetical protein
VLAWLGELFISAGSKMFSCADTMEEEMREFRRAQAFARAFGDSLQASAQAEAERAAVDRVVPLRRSLRRLELDE